MTSVEAKKTHRSVDMCFLYFKKMFGITICAFRRARMRQRSITYETPSLGFEHKEQMLKIINNSRTFPVFAADSPLAIPGDEQRAVLKTLTSTIVLLDTKTTDDYSKGYPSCSTFNRPFAGSGN